MNHPDAAIIFWSSITALLTYLYYHDRKNHR